MADEFLITHYDHDGNALAEFLNPAGLKWAYQTGTRGPGKIEYTLSEADTGVERDAFAPKRTDVELTWNGGPLIAGPHWSVNMPLAGEEINVVVNDWLQWLDQPPLLAWDYATAIGGIVAGGVAADLMNIFDGDTVQAVVELLLDPLSQDPAEQIILSPNFTGTTFAEVVGGYLQRSSSQTVLSMIQRLAAMGSPFGFDFWADPDKTLQLVGPRIQSPTGVSPIASFYDGSTIVDGDWTNNGPAGTDVLFTDGGLNTARYWHKTYQPSIDQFRRWGLTVPIDGGDTTTFQVGGTSEGDYRAQADQSRYLNPQKELLLTVKPDADGSIGFTNRIGEAVDVDYEKFPSCYHRIDAYFWVTSQTYRQDVEGSGEWLCDLTLDQIYTN